MKNFVELKDDVLYWSHPQVEKVYPHGGGDINSGVFVDFLALVMRDGTKHDIKYSEDIQKAVTEANQILNEQYPM